jgi:hypothetical protein
MTDLQVVGLLSQLFAIEYRSLSMYLGDAHPWRRAGDERAASTLEDIVADQSALAARIAEAIQDLGGQVAPSNYPMDFTDTHDLSIEFLLHRLLERQRADIAAIERLIPRFGAHRIARELAEESLGSEKAHLEALESLAVQPA